ncbi:bifunctional UDP-N-acetylglucosamine diphosphorylase/glucosamine-1-phosphate N-acetyltransferase GlmU [uncultured Anaerococcus sp.]|uniref:bifunctional UDP-N-acetylglucosamine diphosphorylase/glucosamine-1-phosphate N-acetyltransferase GlmU n=1 Tax=uncultured Anaerococcus sp. TaxID=293428 RepID=UPI002620C372|nr:bifunctional UDP-N-acetylglucosamine diphosphorylase/glucosamine-1-phosphate N-acetyltransferase GlmU [uncultured Anaerococcus sp.]
MLKTIIMAAGEGTRMKSSTSKVLHKLLNREIIKYVVDASNFENSETIVIAGKNKADLEDLLDDVTIIEQKIGKDYPYGTGYATSLALDKIEDDDQVLVLNGDIPLITKASLEEFIENHISYKNSASVLSTKVLNPIGYGRIIRDDNGDFIGIVEHKDLDIKQHIIDEINTGIYIFKGSQLRQAIKNIDTNNTQSELYLTDCIEVLYNNGEKVMAFTANDPDEFYGINTKKELAEAKKIMQKRINENHMINGVLIEDPELAYIDPEVEIGQDTIISGPVKLLGKTIIGKNCIIEGSTRIFDSKISDKVKVDNSVIEKSEVGEATDIGPYAHLRPNAKLGKKVHIGNFVEVKNSNVADGTKAGHLAYIGDADLGSNINIGCGVIFVNYDGKFKHRSSVGDNAFIGSNSNIVGPVNIENDGYIAAGSTITKDVKEGYLSIERAEQKNIEGYVEKKRKRDLEKEKEQK